MIENPKYLQCPNDDEVIWRYMDLAKFIDLAITKSLWFGRQDKLADKHEGTMPFENKIDLFSRLDKIDSSISSREAFNRAETEAENIKSFKRHTLVNSWSLKQSESYALWKIYLGNNSNGVAVQSTIGNFKECLQNEDLSIVPIRINYIHEFSKLKLINQEVVSATKLDFYDFEEEFRGVIFNQFEMINGVKEPKYEFGVKIPVRPEILISKIIISPLAANWFVDIIKKIKIDYLDTKDVEIKLSNSRLKEEL